MEIILIDKAIAFFKVLLIHLTIWLSVQIFIFNSTGIIKINGEDVNSLDVIKLIDYKSALFMFIGVLFISFFLMLKENFGRYSFKLTIKKNTFSQYTNEVASLFTSFVAMGLTTYAFNLDKISKILELLPVSKIIFFAVASIILIDDKKSNYFND